MMEDSSDDLFGNEESVGICIGPQRELIRLFKFNDSKYLWADQVTETTKKSVFEQGAILDSDVGRFPCMVDGGNSFLNRINITNAEENVYVSKSLLSAP